MNSVIKICLFSFIVGCLHKPHGWEECIERGDYSIVKLGKYPYTTSQIKGVSPQLDTKELIELRKTIEEKPELLVKIARHFYPEDKELNFKCQFTGIHDDEVVIRYFSRNIHPKVYAGYSIQFVIKKGDLKSIYLWRVPLE
ncbi:MAG: hypothetical protein QMD71_07860 [bacterium]|nr:hypothetical protein [bacterium]